MTKDKTFKIRRRKKSTLEITRWSDGDITLSISEDWSDQWRTIVLNPKQKQKLLGALRQKP